MLVHWNSRVFAIGVGVFALILIFDAVPWSSPEPESVVSVETRVVEVPSASAVEPADSAAALADPLLPTAAQRRAEQIRTDQLAPSPLPVRSVRPIGSRDTNQAQVPLLLRLVIVAGCIGVAVGAGWIIYARSHAVVVSRRAIAAAERDEMESISPRVGSTVAEEEPIASEPVVSTALIAPKVRTHELETLKGAIRALEETVQAFDSRLADFILTNAEESPPQPRGGEPRRIEFVVEDEGSSVTSPEVLTSLPKTESVDLQASVDAVEAVAESTGTTEITETAETAETTETAATTATTETAETAEPAETAETAEVTETVDPPPAPTRSGAALSLIRSRRASSTGAVEADAAQDPGAAQDPNVGETDSSTSEVAHLDQIGAMRERVLELAGRGLPPADISRQVGLSQIEVGLILRTLFDGGKPDPKSAAIRAAE